MKICTKCKVEKEEKEFGVTKQTKDGLKCWCKPCNVEYSTAYRNKNRESMSEYSRKERLAIRKRILTK